MKIILASLTHNDKSKGWLSRWLIENSKYCDEWIITDDCSDDGTYEAIENFVTTTNIHLTKTEEPTFKTHENKIREQLWNEVRKVAKEGDVIIVLDSDEILTTDFLDFKKMVTNVRKLSNPQFIFKKCEMWNDTHYRIDGLWSNYFARAFFYKDKEWGYNDKGFHFPQIPKYAYVGSEIVNSDLRIKHLAYSTEELRKSKYDFMMSNPQQTKDITYYHLQTTCDKNPKLKKFEEKYDWPDIKLVMICNNLFKLEEKTIQTLKNPHYPGKVDVIFYISKSNYNLVEQIKQLDLNVSGFEVRIKNYPDEYNNQLSNKETFLKRECFNDFKFEKGYIIFIDGHKAITPALLKHVIITEKDVILERLSGSILGVSGEMYKEIRTNKEYLYTGSNVPFNFMLQNILLNRGVKTWGIMGGAPFQLN